MAFGIMCFPDVAADMGAASVEVTQGYITQTCCVSCPFEHFFHCQFCFAVRVGRFCTVVFQNGYPFRFAICRRCGGEHKFIHTIGYHNFQHISCFAQVVFIIFQGIFHAFPYQRISSKMNNRFDIFFLEYIVQERFIGNIAFVELCVRMYRFCVSCFQIIHNHYFSACFTQSIYRMRTDIACATQY